MDDTRDTPVLLTLVKIALSMPVGYAFAYPFLDPTADGGIMRELRAVGPGAAIAITVVFLAAVFVYCRDLQRLLTLVRPQARAMPPRSVWFMFLLPYNFVEDFFIVANVARSLRREAGHNEALRSLRGFGWISGIGWCSAQIVSLMPSRIGAVAGALALVLWGIHWHLVRKASAALAERSLG